MTLYESQTPDAEYALAFKSVRAAKNIFLGLVLLSILASLATVVLVRFGRVLDPSESLTPAALPASASGPASAPTTRGAAARAALAALISPADAYRIQHWNFFLSRAMKISRAVGFLACLLALATFFFASILALLLRKGGADAFVSGFFWTLVLLVILAPWPQIVPGLMPGVVPDVTELQLAPRTGPGGLDAYAEFYVRVLGLPVLALLIWLLVAVKFARGYRRILSGTSAGPASQADRPASPGTRTI